jgi:hypothetical protein
MLFPVSVSLLPSATVRSLRSPSLAVSAPIASIKSSPSSQNPVAQNPGLTEHYDPVCLQLVVPIQHQHAQCRIAAAIRNCFEVDLLRSACWLQRCLKRSLGCLGHLRKTRKEDQTKIGRHEQKWIECSRHVVGAWNVQIVGFVEALSQRHVAM